MAITVKNIIPCKLVSQVQTTQYTARNCKAVIDKFTVTNTSSLAVTITVNLVSSGNVPVLGNSIIYNKSLQAYETYSFPDLVGQVLEPNDYVSTLTSTSGVLILNASGREIT